MIRPTAALRLAAADDAREAVALSAGEDDSPREQRGYADRHRQIQRSLGIQDPERAECERHGEQHARL